MNLRHDHAHWYVQALESKWYKVDGPMDIKLTGRRLAMVRYLNGIFWQLVQSQLSSMPRGLLRVVLKIT